MRFPEAISAATLLTFATLAGCGDKTPAPANGAATVPPGYVVVGVVPDTVKPTVTGNAPVPSKPVTGPPGVAPPTEPHGDFTSSTLSGVYTSAEAREGKELYLGLCAGCHQAVTHTGPVFRAKWAGYPLSELYSFMRTNMPKNEPASLTDDQYRVLLAYMLEMNNMPAGRAPLSTDTATLAKIMIDTVRKK